MVPTMYTCQCYELPTKEFLVSIDYVICWTRIIFNKDLGQHVDISKVVSVEKSQSEEIQILGAKGYVLDVCLRLAE